MTTEQSNPFEALLKSKQLWTMALTALVSFLVSIVPALDAVRNELLTVFLVLGSIAVGGYGIEAAAAAHGTAQAQAYIAQSQLVTSQTVNVQAQEVQAARLAQEAWDRNKDR